ncbi:baculoviral IAP repeat-containing protein 6 isoform X2 [Lutzomyia longipalpis]|uniref:baculoviral IAP repeat-containing protein 6 isoform X2 n=1 Tax=Lutzomyia longipalpis TaxID=7200 RepID=UPI00248451F2|nr:baculoviral IAP repeat-containing protein 6 isoform X2 [Lutzomyia longipalpis]
MGDELKEDGYLNVDADSTHIFYHPNLNVILVFTKTGDVKVIDVNSGVILQSCPLAADGEKISGRYLPKQDKILLWNERNLGIRGDYNGVLLLDTILQTPVKQSDDIVRLELLYSEAMLFLQCIQSLEENGLENTADVSNELMKKIMEAQLHAKKGIKAQKWNIICLELPHSSLKMVANNVLYQLKRLDRHIPALAIASAINERLTDLLIGSRLLDSLTGGNAQRSLMFSEAARRQTFEQWPHMDYKWALPDQMAQAGFYHQPGESGDDRAMCFTCSVCLVCWEKTDEPWSEHERHSPTCPFVKGEYTQNVPLSVTYATSPAIATNGFSIVSRGDDRNLMCTGCVGGEVTVWNIERNLKKILTFRVGTEENLLKAHSVYVLQKFAKIDMELNAIGTYYATNVVVPPPSVPSSSGTLMIDNFPKKKPPGMRNKMIGTKICCGIVAKGSEMSASDARGTEMAMNIENQAKSSEYGIEIPSNCMELDENEEDDEELFLVIYDIVDGNRETMSSGDKAPPEEPIILDTLQTHGQGQDGGAMKKSSLKSIELPERSDEDAVKMFTDMATADDLDNIPEGKDKIDPMEDDFFLETSLLPANYKSKITVNGTIDFGASPPAKSIVKMPTKSHKDDINCVPIQCISLKSLASDSYRIADIIPSHDEKFLLVVLRQQMTREIPKNPDKIITPDTEAPTSDVGECEKMEIGEEDTVGKEGDDKSQNFCQVENMTQLILFKIQEDGFLNETPHCVRHLFEDATPLEICMLPGYEMERKASSQETKDGVFVMTCMDGTLKLLALSTLRTISEASIDGVKFISATYCKSLERMCGCTEKGSLHFYSFYDMEADSGDEHEEHNTTFIVSDSSLSDDSVVSDVSGVTHKRTASSGSTAPSTSTAGYSASHQSDSSTNLIAHKSELSVNDLKLAYALTEFDEMLTPYTAEVPVCWSELVQAQKVRRHPQHLKPGDDTHLTKTWRLHNDATTWDEHLIELCLPKQASLGHIDFKFNLYQQCSNPPAIQITLLKQFSSGFGYRMKAPATNVGNAPVDENIEFNLNSSENPVLSVEYLQTHNAEILAGPIELSSCMDLSEQSGTVTLTSPKLFRTKGRNYLIHIKTMNDPSKDSQGKTRVPVRKKGILRYLSFANHETRCKSKKVPNETSYSFSQEKSSKKSDKNSFYIGCDWLHEISITVRSTNPMCRMVSERSQRSAMLESNGFLVNLLKTACDPTVAMTQNISLDIILWIVSIRMARYRSPRNTESTFPDVHSLQKDCIKIMEMHLSEFIKSCILYGNRSVAHKCVKIILVALEGAHNMKYKKAPNSSFEEALKNGILECFPHITSIKYAGALRWFTLMICGTSNLESYNSIASECLRLLLSVSKEMSNRFNAYSSLLRSRFGLYGMPFELELFDADLPTSAKYAALPTTFASIVKSATSQNPSQGVDLKNFFTSDGSELKMLPFHMRKRGIGNQLKGLLEVETLHYTCIAASEATRLENMDSISAAQATFETPTVSNSVEQIPNDTSKSKEANGAKLENGIDESLVVVKNNLVDKIFYSALKKHKVKEPTQKMYADVMASVSGVQSKDQTIDPLKSMKDMKRLVKILKIDMGSDFGGMDVEADSQYPDTRTKIKALGEKMQQYMDETEESSNILPWHKLLSLPPKQMIVIDRMHSGARRYVILDFGMPIMLTDLVIPACEDLASLFIDIWCFEEESDSIRLAVSADIGSKTLVLSDLQPPPVFRYMKITITGRYGMSATRCKIPIGTFFGHAIVMESESYADPLSKYLKTKTSNLPAQLKILHSLFEDVHCRYSLASSKLMELLDPLLSSDASNMSHMQAYLYRMKESDDSLADHSKIINIYDDCISFQHQLNVIKNVIARLEGALEENPTNPRDAPRLTMGDICTDKLRVLSECLIEALLHFVVEFGTLNTSAMAVAFNQNACETIFNNLVICSDTHMQLATCSFLVKMCCFEPWWGDFIANIFTVWYSSQNSKIFPQDRVFFLLTYLGRKSITMGSCRVTVIDAVLKTLAKFLAPLSTNYRMEFSAEDQEQDGRNDFCHWASTDLQLIGWLLLFLSVCLDDCGDKKDQSSARWDFMSSEVDMSRAKSQGSSSTRLFTRSFKKRLYQNKIPCCTYSNDSQFSIASMTSMAQSPFAMHGQLMPTFDVPQKQDSTYKDIFLKKTMQGKTFPAYLIDASAKVKFKMSKATTTAAAAASSSAPASSTSSASQSAATPTPVTTPLPPVVTKESLVDGNESPFERALRAIKPQNTIIVIRGLIGLILGMDFTCNMDLFLLACKIIARLVSSCRSTIQLSKIITAAQLQQLIRIAVWEDQQQPWAIHAITCLLQDILETDRNFKCDLEEGFSGGAQPMDLGTVDSGSMDDSSLDYVVDNEVMQCVLAKIETMQQQTSTANKDISYADALKTKLPSLMECEDAEMEDLLDDIFDHGKNMMARKDNTSQNRTVFAVSYRSFFSRSVSCAMDARLEYGLESNIEITLRRLSMAASLNLFANWPPVAADGELFESNVDLPAWPEHIVQAWSCPEYSQGYPTHIMLILVFDNIFSDFHESWLNLEQILQMWLTLNGELGDKTPTGNFMAMEAPRIPFGRNAIQGLLSALSWHPNIKLRAWCLGFQCLALACNTNNFDWLNAEYTLEDLTQTQYNRMGTFIVNNQNFEKMLLRFFSGSDMCSSVFDVSRCSGPTACKLLHELFKRLEVQTEKCNTKRKLKETLLMVLQSLIQPNGAIANQQGPIDAQNQLIKELTSYQYEKTDLGIAMSIIESVSHLVYNNISNAERMYCQKSMDNSKNYNTFGSIFATVLGPENTAKAKTVSDNSLLVNLLKLSTILVQTVLPRDGDESSGGSEPLSESFESQTDEIKAEQQNNEQNRVKVPCVADTVLQHYPTMTRLLGSLSHCSSSSFALLAASAMYSSVNPLDTNSAFGEPQTVADAVFQLLMLLSKKASLPVLVVKPIYLFLNTTFHQRALPKLQLSEPFLWFILRVLDSPATVSIFTEMGGIKVLCHSLVRSNRTMINMQPGLVSMIMQHLTPNIAPSSSAAASVSNGTKKSSQAVKSVDGLINFAPFCSISSDISTAQQADVLIQIPTPSHRRARTAAWNYMFYPNESYVDLTITFPTAVLLYEIQLQPHLLSLASCPYAVAVEITRDNAMPPIPISQPMPTVGLTCIRLKLNQPEIATSIVLRLYRPRDSSNIGLTQISIYGTTTFSDASKAAMVGDQLMDEENLAKSSLGWLRVLARCFSVATYKNDETISNAVISAAANFPDFLEACCSLLNVAPQTSTIALQNLETVLLKLGLFSKELGLRLINILLKNTVPQCLKLCNDSVSDLLYDLCVHEDDFTRDRVEAMVMWVQTLYDSIYENLVHPTNPYSGFIKCLASILWTVHTRQLAANLEALITKELFQSVYKWTLILDNGEPLKKAFDAMLCSICCIRPEMFPLLLRRMNVLVPNLSTDLGACISDDRKDTGMTTDDTKQEESDTAEWYSHLMIEDISELNLTKSQLSTIAMACQSTLAIHQLLDSGLPRLLTSVILEFCHKISNIAAAAEEPADPTMAETTCLTDSAKVESTKMMDQSRGKKYPMVSVATCAEILNFFSEVCTEGSMRDWLGSYEGSVFWKPLLDILCNIRPLNADGQIETNYSYLEDSMIKFLSKVTACHPKNQETLTVILISVIRKPASAKTLKQSISGFTRRLVLQLLLESERILVSVHSDMSLHRREQSNAFISNHPSRRPNAHNLLFLMSTHTKCQEILESCITVFSNILPNTQSGGDSKGSSAEQITPSTSHITVSGNGSASSNGGTSTGGQNSSSSGKYSSSKNDLFEMALGQGLEVLSVAAGVTAKDKRLKDVRNQAAALKAKELLPLLRLRNEESMSTNQMTNCAQLMHASCPGVILTSDTTVSQILAMLHSSGVSLSTPCISLNLVQGRKQPDDISDDTLIKASDFEPLPSPLQIFSSHGGLSLLAHYLPTVYPDTPKSNAVHQEKDKSPPASEWVKVEANDDIYEDLDDGMAEQGSKLPAISSVPQHSLSAFGLFLRLPPYSDVLLRDKTRAQCLLRLVLGVTGDGEGNEIYSLSLASTLPTLPFEVFRQLLDSSPLTTDDGVLLRRMVIEVGAINLVLNCLSIFTHHTQHIVPNVVEAAVASVVLPPSDVPLPAQKASTPTGNAIGGEESLTSDDKSHVYWAKGTGFGTGSTQQSWDVEQALLRQKNEEEHVTVLLQALSSYINPGDKFPQSSSDDPGAYHEVCEDTPELPSIFFELLQQSCLIPALCSYLGNDSVLDITRHIPLYRAILQLLRAIALSNQLVLLLQPQQNESGSTISIATLLSNMKSCVDTYASRLKFNKKSNSKGRVFMSCVDEGDDEGLALLIPDIQDTTFLVLRATNADKHPTTADDAGTIDRPISRSLEQRYMEIMKKLQFDTYEMISETENGYRFVVSYHFESNMRMSGDRYHPIRVKRLAQETVTLSTSLPLSYSSSVFVRCDTDRLDVMKVLITGPADTPYANGCFEFDVFFPPDYPNSPMMINLETTGRHTVRFNPNLYNDGKVCLSVLNTWHGRPEEKWNAQTSSFLQVLVSIQSLILVPEPYFNEPGFERSRGTPSGTHSSREYNSNIYQACVRWAMLEQIKNPNPCFKEVIHTHFWLKRNEICTQIEKWIEELSKPQYSERNGRNISFNSMVLRRQYRHLREELANLPTPEGLEDLECPFLATVPTSPKASECGTQTSSGGSSGCPCPSSGGGNTSPTPSQLPPLQAMDTAVSSDGTTISDLMDEDENPGLG